MSSLVEQDEVICNGNEVRYVICTTVYFHVIKPSIQSNTYIVMPIEVNPVCSTTSFPP